MTQLMETALTAVGLFGKTDFYTGYDFLNTLTGLNEEHASFRDFNIAIRADARPFQDDLDREEWLEGKAKLLGAALKAAGTGFEAGIKNYEPWGVYLIREDGEAFTEQEMEAAVVKACRVIQNSLPRLNPRVQHLFFWANTYLEHVAPEVMVQDVLMPDNLNRPQFIEVILQGGVERTSEFVNVIRQTAERYGHKLTVSGGSEQGGTTRVTIENEQGISTSQLAQDGVNQQARAVTSAAIVELLATKAFYIKPRSIDVTLDLRHQDQARGAPTDAYIGLGMNVSETLFESFAGLAKKYLPEDYSFTLEKQDGQSVVHLSAPNGISSNTLGKTIVSINGHQKE